jgi:hypothetical protein
MTMHSVCGFAIGAGRGIEPQGPKPADFEFHRQFCTVVKVLFLLLLYFSTGYRKRELRRYDPIRCVLSVKLLRFYDRRRKASWPERLKAIQRSQRAPPERFN